MGFFLSFLYTTLGMEENEHKEDGEFVNIPASSKSKEDFFIESAIFNSLKLTIDYKPKRVDVNNLHYSELLNLVPVDVATVTLSKVVYVTLSSDLRLGSYQRRSRMANVTKKLVRRMDASNNAVSTYSIYIRHTLSTV